MYLKSLELHGFKSFPDKVRLTFDKGLTGVVGPNGSGKSNIGDAVRWVLGEQSTKTLRGNKMEDVIFSGTTARKAVGFASVTLTIDNSQGELKNDEKEVAVTRKIYRSGESEYKINGKNVRLKDINELFMDTGLGRDGYSIIGQGRIAEIVDAKSSERRDIFEEAAGISKFRYKRAEAERKLVQAQDNISRLQDIVSELESRVGPLKQQSEKAEKFLVLADERKQLEISLWINSLNDLKKIIDKLSEDSLICSAQYESVENHIEQEEDQIQQAYQKMREITLQIDEYKSMILDAERESSEYRSEIAVCENDIQHSRSLIDSIKEKQNSEENNKKLLSDKEDEFRKKLEQTQKSKEETETELKKIEESFENIEKEALSVQESFGQKEVSINALFLRQNEIKLDIAAAETSSAEINSQLEGINRQLQSLSETSAKYQAEKKSTEEVLKVVAERLLETENRLSGLSIAYKNKKTSFDEKKHTYDDIIFSIKGKQQREKLLTDLENNMEGFNYSVKEIIKASKSSRISGISGTVAQLITVDKSYTTAIETALGGALQNIIVKNEDTAKRCIALLKELKKGRATFLPVTSIKPSEFRDNGVRNESGFIAVANEIVECENEYKGIISNLLGRTVIAEDIDYASVIAKKYGYKFRIVTLDGQVINAGGSFTGGSAVQSHGMLSRKNEINDILQEIKELEKSKELIYAQTEKIKAEAEKLRLEIEAEGESKKTLSEDQITFRSDLKSTESILEQNAVQIRSCNDNKQKLDQKIKENAQLLSQSSEELDQISEKIKQEQSGIDSQQTLRNELDEKRTFLSGKLYELKIKRMEFVSSIETIQSDIKRTVDESMNLSENAKNLERQLKDQEQIIEKSLDIIEQKKKTLDNTAQKTDEYHKNIKTACELHDQREKEVTERRNGLKAINDDKERISREISRLDEKKISTQHDYDKIIAGLWESYELTRSEAEEIAVNLDSVINAQKRLNELKSAIRSLGSINVAAIEEYKEVSQRYEFLSAQLSDVETSKKELEKLINDLTADMQTIFAENFVKINKNFKEIFSDLFGGGTADLELTDPENILESGIEIKVAPPGKVIKNLISLSGGEQAFVAIAIYFAILRIKPAPFCILDEIDAALDEVNVRKYAMYLSNFVKTTQFILVTHRRGTMELANVLYGVTMQQNGVSKLLKMNQVDIPDEMQQ